MSTHRVENWGLELWAQCSTFAGCISRYAAILLPLLLWFQDYGDRIPCFWKLFSRVHSAHHACRQFVFLTLGASILALWAREVGPSMRRIHCKTSSMGFVNWWKKLRHERSYREDCFKETLSKHRRKETGCKECFAIVTSALNPKPSALIRGLTEYCWQLFKLLD